MKILIYVLLVVFSGLLLTGCKGKTVYIPVETVKVEYMNKVQRDSIHLYDSIFVREKNDTLLIEKYKYLYRDKYVTDTILKIDSVSVPYPVVETKEVNRLTGFQSFQLWCGRILMLLIAGYVLVRYLSRR